MSIIRTALLSVDSFIFSLQSAETQSCYTLNWSGEIWSLHYGRKKMKEKGKPVSLPFENLQIAKWKSLVPLSHCILSPSVWLLHQFETCISPLWIKIGELPNPSECSTALVLKSIQMNHDAPQHCQIRFVGSDCWWVHCQLSCSIADSTFLHMSVWRGKGMQLSWLGSFAPAC